MRAVVMALLATAGIGGTFACLRSRAARSKIKTESARGVAGAPRSVTLLFRGHVREALDAPYLLALARNAHTSGVHLIIHACTWSARGGAGDGGAAMLCRFGDTSSVTARDLRAYFAACEHPLACVVVKIDDDDDDGEALPDWERGTCVSASTMRVHAWARAWNAQSRAIKQLPVDDDAIVLSCRFDAFQNVFARTRGLGPARALAIAAESARRGGAIVFAHDAFRPGVDCAYAGKKGALAALARAFEDARAIEQAVAQFPRTHFHEELVWRVACEINKQ